MAWICRTEKRHKYNSRKIPIIRNILLDISYVRSQMSLNKFTLIEIISSNFSNPSGMRLDFNNTKSAGKFTNMHKLNNTCLNNGSRKKFQNVLRQMKMEIHHTKTYRM